MYRLNQVKLNIGKVEADIPSVIKKMLVLPDNVNVSEWHVVKESIDARDKGSIKKVYSVNFRITPDIQLDIDKATGKTYEYPKQGSLKMKNRPVVCGFGPAGMFAALVLAEQGYCPVVLERGKRVEERVKDVEKFWAEGVLDEDSNVQFGEGGAGTFSDGKLTTGIKDVRISKVLQELAAAGGGQEILYKQKPHVGTDILRIVVANLREKITEAGGEIRFGSKLTGIETEGGSITGLRVLCNGEEYSLPAQNLILAVGHSARDTFRTLAQQGVEFVQKPFSIGVRIEHKQEIINEAQYGKNWREYGLPPAEYKLSHRCKNGRGVYTFCMCPGGQVIMSASEKGSVVTNGMSNRARDGEYANSGLLVDVRTEDFGSVEPLAGVDFQEKYEREAFKNGGGNYKAPRSTYSQFKTGKATGAAVRNSLPDFAVEAILEAMPYMGRKLRGFDYDSAKLTAVETRSSSPVRIPRNEQYISNICGLYPAGEGAGYAGGIVSAAVDGIKVAEQIIKTYGPGRGKND